MRKGIRKAIVHGNLLKFWKSPTIRMQAIHHLLWNNGYDGWFVAEIEVEPLEHLSAISKASLAINQFLRS